MVQWDVLWERDVQVDGLWRGQCAGRWERDSVLFFKFYQFAIAPNFLLHSSLYGVNFARCQDFPVI